MVTVLAFATTLLLAVLVSEWARRSVLSTAVLFLVAGFVAGHGDLGLIDLDPTDPVVGKLAELALFSVLFTDGMKVNLRDLTSAWRLPGRALLLGMPLTLLLIAVLARYVAGLPWLQAFMVGAVLSPTDPVFAAAIIGRSEIPQRLRHLLNVESGINDGIALPVVLVLLTLMGVGDSTVASLATELGSGVLLGIGIPWVAARVESWRISRLAAAYQPLFAVAVGLLVFSLTSLLQANEFLAAFAAGITLATSRPQLSEDFHPFGELVTELFKLAALLVFGALMSMQFLYSIPWQGYVFVAVVLLLARPAALALALLRSHLDWKERAVAAWFGPKGFASVVYGILLLKSGAPDADEMFHLIALVVASSIIAHSSTDVPVARWFREPQAASAGAHRPGAADRR